MKLKEKVSWLMGTVQQGLFPQIHQPILATICCDPFLNQSHLNCEVLVRNALRFSGYL